MFSSAELHDCVEDTRDLACSATEIPASCSRLQSDRAGAFAPAHGAGAVIERALSWARGAHDEAGAAGARSDARRRPRPTAPTAAQ